MWCHSPRPAGPGAARRAGADSTDLSPRRGRRSAAVDPSPKQNQTGPFKAREWSRRLPVRFWQFRSDPQRPDSPRRRVPAASAGGPAGWERPGPGGKRQAGSGDEVRSHRGRGGRYGDGCPCATAIRPWAMVVRVRRPSVRGRRSPVCEGHHRAAAIRGRESPVSEGRPRELPELRLGHAPGSGRGGAGSSATARRRTRLLVGRRLRTTGRSGTGSARRRRSTGRTWRSAGSCT